MTTEAPEAPIAPDRMEVLEARVAQFASELQDLAAVLAPQGYLTPQENRVSSGEEAPPPVFASVEEWVEQYFLVVFARSTGGTLRWCDQWRTHAEAVLRLEALWRSWETLRLDPNLGMATWLTNFLDPQLGSLLHAQGTFGGCTADRHRPA
jgi:hypothetical protein